MVDKKSLPAWILDSAAAWVLLLPFAETRMIRRPEGPSMDEVDLRWPMNRRLVCVA